MHDADCTNSRRSGTVLVRLLPNKLTTLLGRSAGFGGAACSGRGVDRAAVALGNQSPYTSSVSVKVLCSSHFDTTVK
jgi:hypothetical protein